jgi:AmiR/NasT family two-component response regulator
LTLLVGSASLNGELAEFAAIRTGSGVTQQVITVVVADDHPMYRDGLSAALTRRDEFHLVGEYGDGHAARREIERLAPDVAVIDLRR